MKKQPLFILFLVPVFLLSCKNHRPASASNIFTTKLEHHLISSGDNRPDFNPYRDSVDYFLYALHTGISAGEFARSAGWTDSTLQSHVKQLENSGFITKGKGGELLPSCMIVTQSAGEKLYERSETAAKEIADSLRSFVPACKAAFSTLSFSGRHSFDELSFFLLSDVLLDNWQINNVEKEFINQPRTARHGKNYYYQVAELKPGDSIEVFGIYGNQVLCNDSFCVAVYGNRRSHIRLEEYFTRKDLPFITPEDEVIFKALADQFKPALISILQRHKAEFETGYRQSVYSEQISFAEYFMWLYHFIYTRATDILNEQGVIHIPADGNFFYSGK